MCLLHLYICHNKAVILPNFARVVPSGRINCFCFQLSFASLLPSSKNIGLNLEQDSNQHICSRGDYIELFRFTVFFLLVRIDNPTSFYNFLVFVTRAFWQIVGVKITIKFCRKSWKSGTKHLPGLQLNQTWCYHVLLAQCIAKRSNIYLCNKDNK